MSLHRQNPRRDENEGDIVATLRAVGCCVRRLSGADVPDLLVGFCGTTYLLGVKRQDGPRGGTSAGRDRKSGDHCPVEWSGGRWLIVTTPREALEAVGLADECRSLRDVG